MWNGYRRLLPWAAMPCLRCARCTSQPSSPYSRRLSAVPGVYDQHVRACTDNLEDSQQVGSPPSSPLLCSCLPLIFNSRYLGQVRPPHQPSGKKKKKEMPHSSLSTWRCSASAKAARTEACYLPSMGRGGDALTGAGQPAGRQRLTAAACLLFRTAKSFQAAGGAGLALHCVWMQGHRHGACALAPFCVPPQP